MRFSRRRLVFVGTALLAVVSAAAYLFWPASPQVTWDSFRRVSPRTSGTRAEVYEAIGGPPGDYRRQGFIGGPPGRPPAYNYTTAETWACDQGEIHVWFGGDGRMTLLVGVPSPGFRPTFLQNVRLRWSL